LDAKFSKADPLIGTVVKKSAVLMAPPLKVSRHHHHHHSNVAGVKLSVSEGLAEESGVNKWKGG